MIFSLIGGAFILIGLVFFTGSAMGIIRFPDFYSRMHAAGKGDTLSSLLVLLGFCVHELRDFESFSQDWIILLVIVKILAVSGFILLTSPTSTHALMDAGWEDGIKPIIEPEHDNHLAEDSRKKP